MAETVSKSRFKAKALEYLRNVEHRHEELIITDHGRPVAKIVPLVSDVVDLLAPFRGSVTRYQDPLAPVGDGDWEVLG